MTPDDEAMLAMLDARMSVASIAAVMGRSPSRLAVRLEALVKAREAVAPVVEPEVVAPPVHAVETTTIELPIPAGETIPSSQGGARAAEAVTGDSPVASAPTIKPQRHTYVGVTAKKLRFCRWFVEAGWQVGTTARLFDVEVEDLAEALG